MADVSITAANVGLRGGSASVIDVVQYGDTITQGQAVYLDETAGTYKKTDADALATAAAVGIALTPGISGGIGVIAKNGARVAIGATVLSGRLYGISSSAGAIAPIGDLGAGKFETIIGRAVSTSEIELNIYVATSAKT